uniref:PROP1-like PPR domain-containing protein n=1 Tax=Aegilops tauschii TaxID=37682 RepID=N1R2F5_AEGTA
MDEWLRQRFRLSQQQILAYVRELNMFKKNEGVLKLLAWMEARGANLSPGHQAVRLDLVSKVHGIQAPEEYFWSLPNISKSVKTYSCLLNCYGQHGLAYKGLELYENMKAKNIVPDKLVYNHLLKLYQKAGQPEKVCSTFEEMRESEQFGKAEVALKKAEEVMDKAELHPCNVILSLHALCGNSTEVKRIWESLKSTFKKCLNRSYLVMLQGLSMIDDFESLQQIFQEWQSNHEHYDMRITNIMIKAYLDKNMIDEAEAICQSTMAQGRCDERTVYIFAEFYLDKSDVNAALEILRDAKNMVTTRKWVPSEMVTTHKWVPTKELVSRFLKHYEESKDVAGAESFLEWLKKIELNAL